MDYAERLKRNLALSDETMVRMARASQAEDFFALLKEYIRLRFVIDDGDFWSDDIRELASFSLEHQRAAIGGGEPDGLRDTSLNCAGASSAETKQILLLMKLKKDLTIDLSPEYIGTAKSVSDIAQRAFSQIEARRAAGQR